MWLQTIAASCDKIHIYKLRLADYIKEVSPQYQTYLNKLSQDFVLTCLQVTRHRKMNNKSQQPWPSCNKITGL